MGAKIKSNTIHEIGQQKQVHSSLLVSLLLVLSGWQGQLVATHHPLVMTHIVPIDCFHYGSLFLGCNLFHALMTQFRNAITRRDMHTMTMQFNSPSLRKSLKSLLQNAVSLSTSISAGMPYSQNRLSKWLMTLSQCLCPLRHGPQRIEALSLYGSRWALSEDSGFNSYSSQPEVYFVKNVVR